jgi:hypothetical protein
MEQPPPDEQHQVRRREARMIVSWPVIVEKIADRVQRLPSELEAVYERVKADGSEVGKLFKARIHDVSMNGVFVEGEALPLLSRVAIMFNVPGFRMVEAIGWVLWRRRAPCTFEDREHRKLELPAGFGVMIEWMSLESRLEIARRIARGIEA